MKNSILKLSLFSMLVAALVLLGMYRAESATSTTSLNVTATVTAYATVRVLADLTFGAYDPVAGNNASASIGVTVTDGVPFKVYGDYHDEVDLLKLERTGGGSHLDYSLWENSNRTIRFVAATVSQKTGVGLEQVFDIWGYLPPNQAPTLGDYTDVVTVTVEY